MTDNTSAGSSATRTQLFAAVLLLVPPVAAPTAAREDGATVARAKRVLERHALAHPGQPERGRALFQDEKRTRCLSCHRVGKQGGDIGPDLTRIRQKYGPAEIFDAIERR